MRKIKVLNLYAGIGGNRKLWNDVEVTAVEENETIATIYSDNFPHDKIVIGDAHQYLLENYKEFDFIWSSPPCPTHSRSRYWGFGVNGKSPIFPDMKLYEEIIFLQYHCKNLYIVENVIPYYNPLIKITS
jgi:DNA (cytosine-5)-methyltransferase 1